MFIGVDYLKSPHCLTVMRQSFVLFLPIGNSNSLISQLSQQTRPQKFTCGLSSTFLYTWLGESRLEGLLQERDGLFKKLCCYITWPQGAVFQPHFPPPPPAAPKQGHTSLQSRCSSRSTRFTTVPLYQLSSAK